MSTAALVQHAVDLLGTQRTLAREIGVSQACIHKWVRGGRISAEKAVLLERATNGVVTAGQLRPDLWSDRDSAA